ncbi:SUC5, partial [Symbiodinium natans]
DVHTPLVQEERSAGATLRIIWGNQALLATYTVTLLAWLGWISLQIYQTEFVATEVYQGSADESSPANKAYVTGVHAASRALILNAVLMTGTTYLIPTVLRKLGKARLWSLSTGATALMLAASILISRTHAKAASSAWLALLGPLYGIQQTIPFLVVSEEAPKDLLGELNGFLNVALCIPQLLVSLLGGWVVALAGTDSLLFTAGAVCDVVATVVCLRLLV